MFRKTNTQPQGRKDRRQARSRQTLLLLSEITLVAAAGLFLLAGCGGGGNGNSGGGTTTGTGTGGVSPFAGSYQGVSLNTSGQYAPAVGTTQITVTPSGAISSATLNSDGSTDSVSGTISSTGAFTLSKNGNSVSGTMSQNAATHVFSTAFTESNGTKGVLNMGLVPTASPLAGSYSGTVASSSGGTFPMTLVIVPGGAVTGAVGTSSGANQGFTLSGYVDASSNAYLAYTSGGVPAESVGGLTLTGTALTGTLQEAGSDGSNPTATLALTKQ